MERNKITLILFLFAVLISPLIQSDIFAGESVDKFYKVNKIIDGNTIELEGGNRMRYIGIDAPETMKKKGGRWVYAPEPYGDYAKKINEKIAGKSVRIEFDVVREDKYGRKLVYLYNQEGEMVNIELLKSGAALVYSFPPNTKYYYKFINAALNAKKERKGIWGSIVEIPISQAGKYVNKLISFKDKVEKVEESGKKKIIFFVNNTKLRGIIYNSNLEAFFPDNEDFIRNIDGKNIEVIGKIRNKGNLRIVIYNPLQIKVLNQ